jgi:hypothetical protein
MQSRDGFAASKPNIWVALAGAALVIALAIGLLQGGADANQVGAAGYGGGGNTGNGNPSPRCNQGGYATPCPSDVSAVSNKPAKPKKGKGFKVSFNSESGGVYSVVVIKKKKKVTSLETGRTGAGKTTTKKVGKGLKAGKYELRVTVNTGQLPDVAKKKLEIVKK